MISAIWLLKDSSAALAVAASVDKSAVNPASAPPALSASAFKAAVISLSVVDKASRFSTNPGKSLFLIPNGSKNV